MSNFICSECGMNNIDCGGAGYKTPKEIELEKKLAIATKALKDIKEHTKELSLPSYTGMLCYKALKEMEGVK